MATDRPINLDRVAQALFHEWIMQVAYHYHPEWYGQIPEWEGMKPSAQEWWRSFARRILEAGK